jgi:hypothetical protein
MPRCIGRRSSGGAAANLDRRTLQVQTEALYYVRQRASGAELTTCNLYFVLPLDWRLQ